MAYTERVRELVQQGDHLFASRQPLDRLWQETADNFYVERADFTTVRNIGEDFAGHLTTSYPMLARRELGNAFGSMLRPTEKQWFHIGLRRERMSNDERRWLERARDAQFRAMYEPPAMFSKATSLADHDYATFGQTVISVQLRKDRGGFLYRNWHLRDVVWAEDENGNVTDPQRKWKPTARQLEKTFGKDNLHRDVQRMLSEDPFGTVNVRHIVAEAQDYEINGKTVAAPRVSIFVDVDHETIIEEMPVFGRIYRIPRWWTLPGSQYAYSPATVAALPDARLMQEITLTLLKAGQKYVDPPMLAVREAIRDDIDIGSGGLTWVDAEYDERLGEVLRPISQDRGGMPIGLEMADRVQGLMAEAFFLNKLNMPPVGGPEMTAFEVAQRIQEFIRNALPLFGPMESEYNAAIVEETFDVGLRAGLFGSPQDIPESLQGEDVVFRFESPLHDAIEAVKADTFMRTKQLLAEAAPLDPLAPAMVDGRKALRDALKGVKTPASWMRSKEEMEAIEVAEAEKRQRDELLETVSMGAEVAEQVGVAGQALSAST